MSNLGRKFGTGVDVLLPSISQPLLSYHHSGLLKDLFVLITWHSLDISPPLTAVESVLNCRSLQLHSAGDVREQVCWHRAWSSSIRARSFSQ